MKNYAWAIFQYSYMTDDETWTFHSAHWSRDRARLFAKGLNGKTRVRKIAYEVLPDKPQKQLGDTLQDVMYAVARCG